MVFGKDDFIIKFGDTSQSSNNGTQKLENENGKTKKNNQSVFKGEIAPSQDDLAGNKLSSEKKDVNIDFGKNKVITLGDSNGVSKKYLLDQVNNDLHDGLLVAGLFYGKYDKNSDNILSKKELDDFKLDLLKYAKDGKLSDTEAKKFLQNELKLEGYKRADLEKLVELIESEDDNITSVDENYEENTSTITYKPDKFGRVLSEKFDVDSRPLKLKSSVLKDNNVTTSTTYINGDRDKIQEQVIENDPIKTVLIYDKDGKKVDLQKRYDYNKNELSVTEFSADNSKMIYNYDGVDENLGNIKSVIQSSKENGVNVDKYFDPKKVDYNKPIKIVKNKGLPIETTTKYLYSNEDPLEYDATAFDSNGSVLFFENSTKLKNNNFLYQKYDYGAGGKFRPKERILYESDDKTLKSKQIFEYNEVGKLTAINFYDKDGKLIERKDKFGIDGHIGRAYQKKGDCFLLATINSLANNEKGQKLLNDNIVQSFGENGEPVYKIKFPGAEIARKSLSTKLPKDKVYIQGEYTITLDEMIKAQEEFDFSYGDDEVLLYELAYNKYRTDVNKTVKANNINPLETYNRAGLTLGFDKDPISGGYGSEASFILTGHKSKEWQRWEDLKIGLLLDSSSHKLEVKTGIEFPPEPKVEDTSDSGENNETKKPEKYISLSSFMETADATLDESLVDEIIDTLVKDGQDGKIDNNFPTVGMYVAYSEDNYFGAHEMSVLGIKDGVVSLIDSNEPTKPYTMSLKDFKLAMISLTNND